MHDAHCDKQAESVSQNSYKEVVAWLFRFTSCTNMMVETTKQSNEYSRYNDVAQTYNYLIAPFIRAYHSLTKKRFFFFLEKLLS